MKRNLLLIISTGLLISACISCTTSNSSVEPSKVSEQSSLSDSIASVNSQESISLESSILVSSEEKIISSESSVISQSSSSSEKISSAESSESSGQIDDKTRSITVKYSGALDSTKQYEYSFKYGAEMFDASSSTFNGDIALFAFGSSLANVSKESITKFYSDAGFDNLYLSETYTKGHTDSSIGFAFAHKKEDDKELVSVSIQGFEYGREWSDNFNIGIEGDHAGFAARADEVKMFLKGYINSKGYSKENVKLLVTGYSRAAAVANLLGKRINDDQSIATVENTFIYTFECPQCSILRGEYTNIFNVINNSDLITYFPPVEYGFARYGKDIDIYDENIDELLTSYDEQLALPPFTAIDEAIPDEQSFIKYILNSMLTYEEYSEGPKQTQTRAEFVNNYQSSVGYALSLFFSLKSSTVDKLKNDLSSKSMWDLMGLLTDDGLYTFLKPYLDEDGIQYNDEQLRFHTNNATNFVLGPGQAILGLAVNMDNLNRLISMHLPEINYVLLLNLLSNNESK